MRNSSKKILAMIGKKWRYDTPYVILFFLVIFFLHTHAPNTGGDTPSYVDFSLIRPPVYPLFIWIFHWAGRYQFQLIMWAQSLITFFSLLYARNWLRINLELPNILIFFILLLTLITISFHFQMNDIASEGLAFPFFIFTFFLSITCFQQYNIKKIILLAIWVSILILTKLQFYYFYGIFICLISWHIMNRTPIKSIAVCTAILSVSILFTTLIDHTYHYVKNNAFSSELAVGFQFIIQPVFLAHTNPATYFKNTREKKYVQSIFDKIKNQKLNQDAALLKGFRPLYYEYAYEEYNKNYIAIQTIEGHTFRHLSMKVRNKITLAIAKTLTLHDLKKNVYFYGWKVIDAMNGVSLFLFFCLLLVSVLCKVFKDKAYNSGLPQLFVVLSVIITFANALLVVIVEPACSPYFCYTQFLLYCLAALFADRIFFKNSL